MEEHGDGNFQQQYYENKPVHDESKLNQKSIAVQLDAGAIRVPRKRMRKVSSYIDRYSIHLQHIFLLLLLRKMFTY